jgi:cell division protein FtsL
MKEEDKLLTKVGTETPFTVPEGYFDQLTSEVMNKLSEQEVIRFERKKVTRWEKVKPLFYLAAVFVGAALIIRVASTNPKPAQTQSAGVTAAEIDTDSVSDQYINYALNQSMLDDYSLYVYLADGSDSE